MKYIVDWIFSYYNLNHMLVNLGNIWIIEFNEIGQEPWKNYIVTLKEVIFFRK